MPKHSKPRAGSLQFWPRKRAKRIYPRLKIPEDINDNGIVGFAGFKAGMMHVLVDNKPKAVTVIDAPPLFVCGIRYYKNKQVIGEKWIKTKYFKQLERKVKNPNTDDVKKKYDDIKLIVATQPEKSSMKKKKPDVFELPLLGELKEKERIANDLFGKEISVSDVFTQGEYVDVSAVTKGHGFTGVVKRFGVKIQGRKNEQHHRHIGSVGGVVPRRVLWQVPMPGQYGFFTRTELNKRILDIGDAKKLKKEFCHYGKVKHTYVLIEGSVPGPRKRLVMFRKSVRNKQPKHPGMVIL